jgi:hypothetical protein
MAKFYTGTDGSLSVDGTKIGKVSGWSFDGAVQSLETTTLADSVTTYRAGRQSYSGSCEVLYYADNQERLAAAPLLGDVLRTGAVPPDQKRRLELTAGNRKLSFDALITSVSTGLQVGEVMRASVSFVVCGPLVDASLGGS